MSPKAQELARRRMVLQQRSEVLRNGVAQHAVTLQPWLTAADTVRSAGQWLRRNPLWVGAAVTTLVVVRPRRTLALGLRVWTGWQWWQRARTAWADASAQR